MNVLVDIRQTLSSSKGPSQPDRTFGTPTKEVRPSLLSVPINLLCCEQSTYREVNSIPYLGHFSPIWHDEVIRSVERECHAQCMPRLRFMYFVHMSCGSYF